MPMPRSTERSRQRLENAGAEASSRQVGIVFEISSLPFGSYSLLTLTYVSSALTDEIYIVPGTVRTVSLHAVLLQSTSFKY